MSDEKAEAAKAAEDLALLMMDFFNSADVHKILDDLDPTLARYIIAASALRVAATNVCSALSDNTQNEDEIADDIRKLFTQFEDVMQKFTDDHS